MNYEQANIVKELALGVNKVLERLEWECPRQLCYKGRILGALDPTQCPICKGEGKLHYTWTPQVGEFFINIIGDIVCIGDSSQQKFVTGAYIDRHNLIPILEWEVIERVLEKAGCSVRLSDFGMAGDYNYRFEIWAEGGTIQVSKIGKTRQEAVYRAVIALGKEMKQ